MPAPALGCSPPRAYLIPIKPPETLPPACFVIPRPAWERLGLQGTCLPLQGGSPWALRVEGEVWASRYGVESLAGPCSHRNSQFPRTWPIWGKAIETLFSLSFFKDLFLEIINILLDVRCRRGTMLFFISWDPLLPPPPRPRACSASWVLLLLTVQRKPLRGWGGGLDS